MGTMAPPFLPAPGVDALGAATPGVITVTVSPTPTSS